MTSNVCPRLSAPGYALPVRLGLRQPDTGMHRIDGSWWPRSPDLGAELPPLLKVLEERWGLITRVTVDRDMWLAGPVRMVIAGRAVHINWSSSMGHRRTACLVSQGVGRCDLRVVPLHASPAQAHRIMTR